MKIRALVFIGITCVFTLPLICFAACLPAPVGMTAWWAGDGTAEDLASTNNAIVHGGVSYVTGKVGLAFNFNGTSGYLNASNNPSLNPTGSFTIEGWIYPRQNRVQTLMQKWMDNPSFSNQRSYSFYTTPNNALTLAISDVAHQQDGSFHSFSTGNNVFGLNTWSHVAAVYDQSTGARRIYVNGIKVAERIDAPINILSSTAFPVIGGGFAYGYLDSQFDGLIDEWCFYTRALSTVEIQEMYLADSAGKCKKPFIITQPKSQLGYWGQSVTFTVAADGSSPLGYQWLFNSAPISGASGTSLILNDLQLTNGGAYRVVVTNAVGSVTSAIANLTINPAGVSADLYTGVTIAGVSGLTYGVQFTLDLTSSTNWQGLTNVTLTTSNTIWYDSYPAKHPQRYYRVIPGPIPIP